MIIRTKEREKMVRLLEPLETKKLTLKNRLVFPPMATGKSNEGKLGQDLLDYYTQLMDIF